MLSSCSGKRLCGPSEKGCNKPYDRKDNAFQRDAQLFHFFFRLLTEEKTSIESTSKCKLPAKLVIMFEKDLIWREEF